MMSSNRETKADMASLGMSSDIMSLNGLKYRIPQPLSTGVSRSYKKEYSQKTSYSKNQVMVFDLNTGTTFADPDTAKLAFDYNHVLSVPAGPANGVFTWCGSLGAAALISEIRVISKNGIELDRISDAAMLAKIFVDYTATSDMLGELQMADGYGDDAATNANKVDNGENTLDDPLQVVIPLKYLCGFFRPTIRDMLIPAGLASGLRIEFSLISDIVQAIKTDGPIPVSFTVDNPVLIIETTEMNDPTQSALMRESAANGLEYTFPSYYSTKLNVASNATIATQVNKAVSQATRVFLILQDALKDDIDEIKIDSLNSARLDAYDTYQFRVGQNYFPNLVVSQKTEKMAYALSTFKGWSDNVGTGVDFDGYHRGGKAVVATSLETASRLNLSGLMLNNSSTAEVRIKAGTTIPVNGVFRGVFFLEFIAVVKTALNKSSLRI